MSNRFAWIPWIEEQGDVLISETLEPVKDFTLLPIDFHQRKNEQARRSSLDFAVQCPTAFARLFERKLMALPGPIHGLILTLDWIGPMKVAASVARYHGLPVIVLPHEGIYIEANRFYTNPYDGTNVPMGDIYLAWGGLQKKQMVERGYPIDKIKCISSPKLQSAAQYQPTLTKGEYTARLGLKSQRPVVLFAAQNLDNCDEPDKARFRQADALENLVEVCQKNDFSLVIRLPPANISSIFVDEIARRFGTELPFCLTQYEANKAELAPREALYHADCVVSISSTMLLEKALMNGPTLVLDYIETLSLFSEQGKCPSASSQQELSLKLPKLVNKQERSFSASGWKQMEQEFSGGSFEDFDAHEQIAKIMRSYKQAHFLEGRPAFFTGMFVPTSFWLRLFHSMRKLPLGRTIARRLFKPLA